MECSVAAAVVAVVGVTAVTGSAFVALAGSLTVVVIVETEMVVMIVTTVRFGLQTEEQIE